LYFVDNRLMADCRNCGAAMRIIRDKGISICDHCGHQQETPAVVDDLEIVAQTAHACPVCATPLSQGRLHGHPVLSCGSCSGLLIEMNRFTTVVEAVRAYDVGSFRAALPPRQTPGDRVLNCPTCGHRLISHQYSGPGNVVIDTCERCLVNWLDHGELRRIALAPDRRTN
jgi:Zn-finger nucleic acid-binding protein